MLTEIAGAIGKGQQVSAIVIALEVETKDVSRLDRFRGHLRLALVDSLIDWSSPGSCLWDEPLHARDKTNDIQDTDNFILLSSFVSKNSLNRSGFTPLLFHSPW